MTQMNMIQALNSAMDVMMGRDASVVTMGEDVGYFGGVFRVTDGLQRKYGEHRVLDSPIAEGGIVATAIGMSVNGLRPVAEIQFADYIYPAYDQIVSELARIRYRTGGEFYAPVTIRTPCGGGIRGGQTHSQSPEALFAHVCGIKVVMPSNPYDAKGLLISAIEDDDPVMFFEPKRLYNGPFDGDPNKPAVGLELASQGRRAGRPLPRADRRARRSCAPATQVTVVTYGTMVHVCIAAAESLDIDAEVIDIRSIVPLDERNDRQLGEEDRALRGRARGDALRGLRRGDPLDRPGRVLLAPGSADPARGGLGHAVSARVRVGILPRPGARRGRTEGNGGGDNEPACREAAGPRRRHGLLGDRRVARQGRRRRRRRPADGRDVDRQGRRRDARRPSRAASSSLGGQPGDHIAVGAELIVLETAKVPRQRPRPLPQRFRRRAGERPSRLTSLARPLPRTRDPARARRRPLRARVV